MDKLLRLNSKDTVAIATSPLKKDQVIKIGDRSVKIREDIPAGHKVALQPMEKEEQVLRYGLAIGHTTRPIEEGEWVHIHNMFTNLEDIVEYTYDGFPEPQPGAKGEMRHFSGYLRENGRVGIRNELWIIPTVFCVNGPAQKLAEHMNKVHPQTSSFDGAYALVHPHGCSQTGLDLEHTQQVLASLACHPNAGGVLVLGLGCEANCMDLFLPFLNTNDRIRTLNCQEVGDEIKEGVSILEELYDRMSSDKRTSQPVSKLALAVNCGGSDTFSGITANPLVGRVTEELTSLGGTVLMTEVPEMFGAEHLLMAKAENEEVFEGIVEMINDYKRYYQKYGEVIYKNPVPGNIAGGISTLEEKSLGCIQKGGQAIVRDVLPYGGRLRKSGFCLISGPGNDVVGITVQEAAGCVMTIFTTGRGTPAGFAAPLMRVSSNTDLATRKPHWVDYDAGTLMSGKSMDLAAEELFELVLKVANGEVRPHAERNGYRQIGIWKDGVTN
jgi:altronate hydrolase